MESNYYIMSVVFTAKKGMKQMLKKSLINLTKETLKENGCIMFNLHQSSTNQEKFMIYEKWASWADHDNHDKSPHVLEWRRNKHVFLEEMQTEKSIWNNILE